MNKAYTIMYTYKICKKYNNLKILFEKIKKIIEKSTN